MREDETPTTAFPLDIEADLEAEINGETDGDADDASADADTSKVSGWGRVLRGNRTLWIVAACAVVSLVAGLLIGHFLISPAEANGDTPEPGLVTVPVEFGSLSNDVTLRADVGYADAVEVTIDTTGTGERAVVTGQVPAVGATFTPLSIALEVAGRPVIVLPGELPAYRTLRVGVSGPDVLQLKQALVAVGINPGDVGSDVFDGATADAVGQLYAQAGYPTPSSGEDATAGVRSAEENVRSANDSVSQAQAALDAAGSGPSKVEAWQADVKVAQAEQALADAKAKGEGVQQAEWDLQTAKLERDQLWAAKNTGAERAMLDSAYAQVEAANQALETARQSVLPFLPSSEVLYLTELPRRVDAVNVKRGDTVSGSSMTVSGATVRLTGAAAEADARLLKVGAEGTFELPDGTEHRAVISALNAGKDSKARWEVLLDPDPLTPEQIQQLQGNNVRVKIAVGATEGDVLSVPLAALTAGPGGESRVEVVESDPRKGEDAETRIVVVKTGLAARGAVEITPTEGELEEGELVVVGR
ncbi:hypothetical protein [Microbacterium sp. LWH12-1.2]|uniref:hypothetical protein n=1 Tax=Microbacterium sp. LWH12-1.2 TaxID=3135259 RepID=UPI0034236256